MDPYTPRVIKASPAAERNVSVISPEQGAGCGSDTSFPTAADAITGMEGLETPSWWVNHRLSSTISTSSKFEPLAVKLSTL
jgi:hypothetical protein